MYTIRHYGIIKEGDSYVYQGNWKSSGKNLAFLVGNGDCYIVSQKVRGSSKVFIDKILEEEGYIYNDLKNFKIKSFLREKTAKDEDGNEIILKEKVVAFWSKNFNLRKKHKRELLEERINEYLKNPSKYKASNRYGIKKYLKEVEINQDTGEIDMDESKIIDRYRGLWKIELKDIF